MNVLFLSLAPIKDLSKPGNYLIYSDLLKQFVQNGHFVRIVSPTTEKTKNLQKQGYAVLNVHTPQMQKVNFVKKGIASLLIGPNIERALKQYCADEHYDLILTATPPVTIAGVVKYIKFRDNSRVYLLLKDIWPQGIVDLGAISKRGLIYRYFRSKEKRLYGLADRIGCMSQANVDYLLKHNSEISPQKVEVCPNSVEPTHFIISAEERAALRKKYCVPQDKTVFIYGGNVGRPQGIPFIIDSLQACSDKKDCFFVICGTGTEYAKLEAYIKDMQPQNVMLLNGLPNQEYEQFVAACDIGLIFLDYRFTIPNFPSRLLSYMQAGIPVLCCTDPNTDIGDIAEQGGFGWKCLSNNVSAFCQAIDNACQADLAQMGAMAKDYLATHYSAEKCYQIIIRNRRSTRLKRS